MHGLKFHFSVKMNRFYCEVIGEQRGLAPAFDLGGGKELRT
jgi:hypothetical protein